MGRSYESSGTMVRTTSPAVVIDGGPTEDGDEPGIDAPRPGLHVAAMHTAPVIGIIMGSASDWPAMEHAARTLRDFGIPWEAQVISAHRAPGKLVAYAGGARAQGLKCLIAGAGCAA